MEERNCMEGHMQYYLGLDNGGTVTKASVYDGQGRELSTCSVDTKMIVPEPGFIERDMDEMWEANCTAIRGAVSQSGIAAEQISAVAVCGHGKGLYLWGKNNCPVRRGIISTDNRAYAYPEKWKEDGTEAKVFELSCQHIMACQPVSLLAWLRDHEPECIDEIRWIFECKDYIRFRLTGKAKAEITDFSGSGFLNLHTQSYDDRILELFGLSFAKEKLPPLCGSAEICGYVTEEAARESGLAAGTPVAGGMFDIDACATAVGVTDDRNVCMIAGTWSINEYLRKEPVLDGSVLMNSISAVPGYYLVEESSATSAGNYAWFINTMLPELKEKAKEDGKSIYSLLDDMLLTVSPEEYVPIFTPFLMASNVHPNAKASFVGISNYHTRAHMVRSVIEGIGFCHRYHMEKLMRSREEQFGVIRFAGGLARSRVIVQIFADILQLPVEIMQAEETGTLGCAIAAAVASGQYGDIAEAASAMTKVRERVEPRPQYKKRYDLKFAFYKDSLEIMDPLWDKMQNLIEKLEEEKEA